MLFIYALRNVKDDDHFQKTKINPIKKLKNNFRLEWTIFSFLTISKRGHEPQINLNFNQIITNRSLNIVINFREPNGTSIICSDHSIREPILHSLYLITPYHMMHRETMDLISISASKCTRILPIPHDFLRNY